MKRLLGILLGLALCLGPLACGRHGSGVGGSTRVLFIGLDGAEWGLINTLMAQGRMPNFQKLMERGVHGELKSLEPLQKSPAIWTTIATGKAPREHGIKTFVEEKDGQPLTQNLRRVKALWNILSATGRKVGVVGWLMSWPAEEVNGFIVTDYIQYAAGRNAKMAHRTYPEALYDEIAPLNRDWRQMPWSTVNQFLGQPLDTTAIGGTNPDTLAILRARPMRWMISADASFTDIALKLGQPTPPPFMAVYLRSMDTFGHLFWNFQHPESWPPGLLDPSMVPYFQSTMERNYAWIDGQLGRILTLADDRTTVVLCSDHGFKGGGGGGVQDHRLEGVLVMAGPHIGRGEITGATVYDITPTVLALFGLPRAEDMPGKVLWAAFDKSIRAEMFKETLPTYETGAGGAAQDGQASPVDEELKERLRSLGYIK